MEWNKENPPPKVVHTKEFESVRKFINAARDAGHDSLHIANDEEALEVIENLQDKPSLKRLELEECPDCHVELGSGVTRCWNSGCKYTVPDGFMAVSKGYDG